MKNLLAFTFLLFIGIGLNAKIKFEHLTTKDGLSTNRVGTILRDSRDYLWIGSEAGLDKYDGYKIKTYRHNDKQSGTISNNDIW